MTAPRGRGEPWGAHQQRGNGGAVTNLVGDELERRRRFGLRRHGDTGDGMVKLMAKMSMRKQDQGMADFSRGGELVVVDVLYEALQAHGIVNVALHREYSPGIVFIFFHGRKYLYHV
jgi:hypothetical protein